MLTESQALIVKSFLKDLCDDKYDSFYSSDYSDAIFHSTDSSDYTEWDYLESKYKCSIYTGFTKMVVHFGGFPCVVKIPFHGVYAPSEEIVTAIFDDHCEIEADMYKGFAENIKPLFLPVEYEFSVGNVKVYSQLYIDETYDDFLYNLMEENEDYEDDCSIYTLNILETSIVRRFGNKFIESIAKNYCCGDYHDSVHIMRLIGNNVMDLHKENYGFKDDKPVIFDYAGISESDNVVKMPF